MVEMGAHPIPGLFLGELVPKATASSLMRLQRVLKEGRVPEDNTSAIRKVISARHSVYSADGSYSGYSIVNQTLEEHIDTAIESTRHGGMVTKAKIEPYERD